MNSQDQVNARFKPCALPFISAIPAVIAICVVLVFMLRLLLRGSLTPKWIRPFVEEPKAELFRLEFARKRVIRPLTFALFACSITGFGLQLSTVFYPRFNIAMAYPTVSWATGSILIAVYRPATTLKSLIFLFGSIFATQLAVLVDNILYPAYQDIPAILSICMALVAVFIILHMPLRDPLLTNADISPPFSPPTSELRSPEDNLSLWQFMSVAWMSPLISLGNKRQLNEEDVWDLGYEFKHRILHDTFSSLEGSVFRRLLQANGLDLLIISTLSIVELVASKLK